MTDELSDFTWLSLYEYIERMIAGVQDSLQQIGGKNTDVSDLAQSNEGLKHELDL